MLAHHHQQSGKVASGFSYQAALLCISTVARRICCLRNWLARVEFSSHIFELNNDLQEFPSGKHYASHQLARGNRVAVVVAGLGGDAGFLARAGAGHLRDGMLHGRRALLLRHGQTVCRRPGLQRRSRDRAAGDWVFLSWSGHAAIRRQGTFTAGDASRCASAGIGRTSQDHPPQRRELL